MGEFSYRGPVTALVGDWSGTLADPYVIAPAKVFVEVFRRQGVEVSMSEARGPMGLKKDLHIQRMFEDPAISARWQARHGRVPGEVDLVTMYADFVPLQLEVLRDHAALLPGIGETMGRLQARGVKVGATTGFTRAMVEILVDEAAKQGFNIDASVGGDEVRNGARPSPHMLYECLDRMGVDQIRSVVKVDDTTSGIYEGHNAGCWTVGVARYSNYMDVDTLEEGEALQGDDLSWKLFEARRKLAEAQPHYVIDSLADIEPVIEEIEARLRAGESP